MALKASLRGGFLGGDGGVELAGGDLFGGGVGEAELAGGEVVFCRGAHGWAEGSAEDGAGCVEVAGAGGRGRGRGRVRSLVFRIRLSKRMASLRSLG